MLCAITPPAASRFTFLAKLAAAAVVAAGDVMLWGYGGGSIMGGFAVLWLATLIIARPAVRRSAAGWIALGGARTLVMNLVLQLTGGAVFLALFASANPVLGQAFDAAEIPDTGTLILRAMLWSAIIGFVWPTLRPRSLRLSGGAWGMFPRLPDPSVTTALMTLGVFNAVFALENLLDIIFLWSGAPLPGDMTLAVTPTAAPTP
jgi:hypothetical protein